MKKTIIKWLFVIPISIILMIPILNTIILDQAIYYSLKQREVYTDLFNRKVK